MIKIIKNDIFLNTGGLGGWLQMEVDDMKGIHRIRIS